MGLESGVQAINLKKITVCAICIWLALLFYISAVLVKVQQSQSNARSQGDGGELTRVAIKRIEQAAKDIEELKSQNNELKELLYKNSKAVAQGLVSLDGTGNALANNGNSGSSGFYNGLNADTRKAHNGLAELWYFISGEIKRIKSSHDNPGLKSRLDRFLNEGRSHYETVMADTLSAQDFGNAGAARFAQLQNLTRLMQKRLHHLQNPADCESAKKVKCVLNKGCGYGCQLHHVTYCFMVAYGTKRTMILDTSSWRYSRKGWNSVFLPVSDSCLSSDDSGVTWRGVDDHDNDLVVSLPIVDSLRPRPPFLPLSFPADLSDQLLKLHGYPPVWFVGQFVYYLQRYSKEMQNELDDKEKTFEFKNPIVGLHVRRTDKVGVEAQFHGIEEYMEFAEAWFRIHQLKTGQKVNQKRVFIATDDSGLLDETRLKYKDYVVIGDKATASSASLNMRYSEFSLHGIISDIYFLSKCDYLVCTFSSQVCRIAYEIMQVTRGDAANWFHSLDDIYYFGGQHGHEQTAWLSHTAKNSEEIDMEVGDTLGVAGNHWDGFSKGKNQRTSRSGLYPSYKVREKWRIENYPKYEEVKL